MAEFEIDDMDGVKLFTWTVADFAAVAWGLSAAGVWDIRTALGGSSELVLLLVGVIGLYSLADTYTDVFQ